jgi:Ser/Thr protein kinase RdoA (MazF antagonist)
MLSKDELRTTLAERWRLTDARIRVHNGGMNSATWYVSQGGRRWVAKAVGPTMERAFRGGLAVAATLERAGFAAGAPVPTVDGELAVTAGRHTLALLRWVPGAPLTGSDAREQRLIGETLARAHQILADVSVDPAESFHWLDPVAPHLAVRPWVRCEVAAAVAALDAYDGRPMPRGLLHMDPAPDAFRWDGGTGVCGLIDWSVGMSGPLLYDVASAVMYVGGPDRARALLDAYAERGGLAPEEVHDGLPVMLRFRWAVQADYFAHRIVAGDLTGIGGADDNEKGLEDARRALASWRFWQYS